jgi:hypothetical protein
LSLILGVFAVGTAVDQYVTKLTKNKTLGGYKNDISKI